MNMKFSEKQAFSTLQMSAPSFQAAAKRQYLDFRLCLCLQKNEIFLVL